MGHRLLLVDDDDGLAEMLAEYLGGHGFDVTRAAHVAGGFALAREQTWDAVILDVMLPDGDGFDLLKDIRRLPDPSHARAPIIMLTARGDDMDRIIGLELGADDYLPKPFNPRELLARLRAVRRRQATTPAEARLRFGRLEIDPGAREVLVDGVVRDLTSHQFSLLLALARRAGRVLSREQLMQDVRGEDLELYDRSIDVHISRIRAAIEDDPKKPKRIVTVRGVGYVFTQRPDDG